ncbi:MAG: hypothetical protein IPJ65_20965 [Archangiaceae bacterium]|nr:hypothetical protein [Archangiaceae bacterium]
MRAPLLIASIAWALQACNTDCPTVNGQPVHLLSELKAFDGALKDQRPAAGVYPYSLQAPFFTDYTHKQRFIQLPSGTHLTFSADGVFDLPIGARIFKTFGHYADQADPTKGETLHETRVLERVGNGYVPYLFIWKDDQSDAECRPGGASLPSTFFDATGASVSINYQTPNVDQCQFCHGYYDPKPLGVKGRQLNHVNDYGAGPVNQLDYLVAQGALQGEVPAPENRPTQLDPTDVTGTLDERVRSYQDTNCGMCHNPKGLARVTGLYLNLEATDPFARGICRPVVAYLRSGGFQRVIEPGRPELSAMSFRLSSMDPDIHMPAGFNQLIDRDGVQLIDGWIQSLPEGTCPR